MPDKDPKVARNDEKVETSEKKEGEQEKIEKSREAPKLKTPEEVRAELKRIDGKIVIERSLLNEARQKLGLEPTDTSVAIESLQGQRQQLVGEESKQDKTRDEFKLSQKSATFFREMEQLARDVDNLDGAEKYVRAGADLRKFREGVIKDPSQLSDALATLVSELQQGIEYHSSSRENFAPEIKPAVDERFRQARSIFVETGRRLFPDVPAQAGTELLLRNVRGRISQVTDPTLDLWVRNFRENIDITDAVKMGDSDPAMLLRKIENQINDAGIAVGTARVNTSPETKKDIAEVSRAVYALELVRQDIESRIPRGAKQKEERQQNTGRERPQENTRIPDAKKLTFDEASEQLKSAKTTEQVRAVLTPKIIEAARAYALSSIDDSIAPAERIVGGAAGKG